MCNVFACLLKWVCLVGCEELISAHSCFWLSQSLGRTCDGKAHTPEWQNVCSNCVLKQKYCGRKIKTKSYNNPQAMCHFLIIHQ